MVRSHSASKKLLVLILAFIPWIAALGPGISRTALHEGAGCATVEPARVHDILEAYPKIECLTHTTSLKYLDGILRAGKIFPKTLLTGVVSRYNTTPGAVYLMLNAREAISPRGIGHFFRSSTTVVIELPKEILDQRIDWHLSSEWLFGEYVEGFSARPSEAKELERILESISSSVKIEENEVVFENPLPLGDGPITLYFYSVEAGEGFFADYPFVLQKWKILSQGISKGGIPTVVIEQRETSPFTAGSVPCGKRGGVQTPSRHSLTRAFTPGLID